MIDRRAPKSLDPDSTRFAEGMLWAVLVFAFVAGAGLMFYLVGRMI